MAPKLSIITPSYNQAGHIERTITSVLDQGYPNLEYVIVDGESTDGTVEIIRRYEDQLAWWVSEPDEGQADAINKGIRRTDGEIVAYINSDDYYLPGAFARAVETLLGTGVKYAAGAVLDMDERGVTGLGAWRPEPPSFYEGRPRGRHWWLLVPFYLPQSSVFWRRELFERNGEFRKDLHYMFDAEFMCRIALAGEELALLPDEALSVRGVHSEQKSADPAPFREEAARFRELLRPRLTPRERIWLYVISSLRALGVFRLTRAIRDRGGLRRITLERPLTSAMSAAGRALDRLPDRVRPPIRSSDRPWRP